MAKRFEDGPPLSVPSPKSHLERRLIRADLDARIAASGPRKVPLTPRETRPTIGPLPTPPVLEQARPTIGPLPTTPVAEPVSEGSVDEMPFINPVGSNPDEEVTEGRIASVRIPPRQPPVRK